MLIQICVGSSCHLKGSEQVVHLFQEAVAEHHLENKVTLAGSFCFNKCNREGVTVQVDDEVFPGVTTASFSDFFSKHVLAKL